jgi:hypothetical protein
MCHVLFEWPLIRTLQKLTIQRFLLSLSWILRQFDGLKVHLTLYDSGFIVVECIKTQEFPLSVFAPF